MSVTPFSLCNSKSLIQTNNVFLSSLQCPYNNTSLLSPLPKPKQFTFRFQNDFSQTRNGFSISASKKGKNGGGNSGSSTTGSSVIETDDFDDEDWDDFDEDDEFVDEDEDMLLPMEKMEKWLERKPRGFGGESVYDTSIEDKLLDEMRLSVEAQTINVDKLKNSPNKLVGSKKDEKEKKALEASPSGIRVRISNIPKKKNIHRDLKVAFKEVPGIVDITPAVSGNKKTKDPICKGFAFVDFKSEEYATRFVKLFAGQDILFGKMPKKIKCQLMSSIPYKPTGNDSTVQKLKVLGSEDDLEAILVKNPSLLSSLVQTESNEPDYQTDEHDRVMVEDDNKNLGSICVDDPNDGDNINFTAKSTAKLNSSKQPDRIGAVKNSYHDKKKIDVDKADNFESIDSNSLKQVNSIQAVEMNLQVEDIEEDFEYIRVEEDPEDGDNINLTSELMAKSNISKKPDIIEAVEKNSPAKAKKNGDKVKVKDTKDNLESIQSSSLKQVNKIQAVAVEKNIKVEDIEENFDSVSVEKLRALVESKTGLDTSDPLETIRALEKRLLSRGKKFGKTKVVADPEDNFASVKLEKKTAVSYSIKSATESMTGVNIPKLTTQSEVDGKKKNLVKGKEKKEAKITIPGSAKRLKLKEKAMLNGVMSKYAKGAASTSKEASIPKNT